jgi:transcriptional regulator
MRAGDLPAFRLTVFLKFANMINMKKTNKLNTTKLTKILSLREKGLTLFEISKIVGNITPQGVDYIIKRFALKKEST